MNHHENSIRVARVAQNVLQIQDVALGEIEVITDANR